MNEPELHLGPHVVSPDLAGWRRERLPRLPETAWLETAPDWICELLSPGTEKIDRGPKRRIYAAHKVEFLWHLDPVARLLEAFVLQSGKWVLFDAFGDGEIVKAPPFDAAPFEIAALWPIDTDETA